MQPEQNGKRKKRVHRRPRKARASAMNQSADDVGDSRTAAAASLVRRKDLTSPPEPGEVVESGQVSENGLPAKTAPSNQPLNIPTISNHQAPDGSVPAPEVADSTVLRSRPVPEVVDMTISASHPAPEGVCLETVPNAPSSGQYGQPTSEDLAAVNRLFVDAIFKDGQILNVNPSIDAQQPGTQLSSAKSRLDAAENSGDLPILVDEATLAMENGTVPTAQSSSMTNKVPPEPSHEAFDTSVPSTEENNKESGKRDWLASHCTACNGRGHIKEDCPDSYLFYLKAQSLNRGPFEKNINVDIPISCYKCASQQHLGDDCPLEPNRKKGVFSADFYNHFLHESMPTPSTDGARLTQNDIQGLNSMPSVAQHPNSSVVPKTNALQLDAVIEPRKIHPLPKKPPSKKLNVHLSQQNPASAPPPTGPAMLGNHHVQYRNKNNPRRPAPPPNPPGTRRGGDSWRPGDDRR